MCYNCGGWGVRGVSPGCSAFGSGEPKGTAAAFYLATAVKEKSHKIKTDNRHGCQATSLPSIGPILGPIPTSRALVKEEMLGFPSAKGYS